MGEKILRHQTVKITRHLLEKKLSACSDAVDELEEAGFLPAVVSTDPEANLPLAILAANSRVWRIKTGASWLAGKYYPWSDLYDGDYLRVSPGEIAQFLAWFADAYLTGKPLL